MHVCYVSTTPYKQDICQMYFLSRVQYADIFLRSQTMLKASKILSK